MAFERGVELVRQVVEVGHLDRVGFFPLRERVVCCSIHVNPSQNLMEKVGCRSKNYAPAKIFGGLFHD